MRGALRTIGLTIALLLVVGSCGDDSVPDSVKYPDLVEFDEIDAALFLGPEHCDWHTTWMVHIRSDDLRGPTTFFNGEEGSAPFPGEHMFVRDPIVVEYYSYATASDLDRSLPSDAREIGSSADGYALWFADSDPDYIYVVSGDRSEAWVRAVEWNLCI